MLETDGPYGGEPCDSTSHSHHIDGDDGIYWQTKLQVIKTNPCIQNYLVNSLFQGQLYKHLKDKNVFINQPDSYFYQGGNKVGMGYNENQFSLPRWEDLTVSRMVNSIMI